MMTSTANEDPKDVYRPDPTVEGSSEGGWTDSSSEDESLGSDQYPDTVYDPILQKESWNPDFRMYKHRKDASRAPAWLARRHCRLFQLWIESKLSKEVYRS